ncbi:MAG TPA: hypothetical protein VGY55_24755 [Pirellulales bacterium]|jgi:hypothetical protein|nr:hypothetical protein [Pirellulales bacterium]
MEKVVYFLGAGFSAPLGLPVMSNFLVKSKDQYFGNRSAFAYFLPVFDTIGELSRIKNYFTTDLFNIEDILSVLEMQYHLGHRTGERSFAKYIEDVISHHTPKIAPSDGVWRRKLFGTDPGAVYGVFVATLLGHSCWLQEPSATSHYRNMPEEQRAVRQTEYSVVSLNYDLVLESYADFIRWDRRFVRSLEDNQGAQINGAYLAKLHGSIDTHDIVPPTWNKTLGGNELSKAWKLAFKLLAEANHIRVIGYSLPTNDAYVRHLFRAANVESQHLKTFDVLCLDRDGHVKERYDEFVSFRDYRFKSASVKDYLERHSHQYGGEVFPDRLEFNKLETSHNEFFDE